MRVYHYLDAYWALDNIRRSRLKISKLDDMNDPYEWKCVRSIDEASQSALEKTEREMVEKHGALCFSRTWNNILMWSHYGDKHKGICLGFDVRDVTPYGVTRDVEYLDGLMVMEDADNPSPEDQQKMLTRLYGAKYVGWRYEEEVRVSLSLDESDENGKYFVSFGDDLKLREVIAGARFPLTDGYKIDDALKGYSEGVRIIKAGRCPEKFEIIVDERGFCGLGPSH